MLTVRLETGDNSYDIFIGHQILEQLGVALRGLDIGADAVVVTNSLIRKLHGHKLAASLRQAGITVKFFEIADSERSKSARTAFKLIEKIVQYNVDKNIFIIAFGGGVVGDLAGYVASAYKRGIPYVQVPTTFLAQVDSAIGGKVAIDLPIGKNLVGAFYHPKMVFSDVGLLTTLSQRQIRNGLSEALKYGIIFDKALFDNILLNTDKLLAANGVALKEVVYHCSRIKARIVSSDEKEAKGIRTILNFGHTFGHALEAACQFKRYHHGEAVALGMCVAASISRRMGFLKKEEELQIVHALQRIGLPTRIDKVSLEGIMQHMRHDKKFIAKKNRFVLSLGIGSVKVVEGVKMSIIHSAIKECQGRK